MIRSIKKPKSNITTVAVWTPKTEIQSLMNEFFEGMKTVFSYSAVFPRRLEADYNTNNHEPVKKLIFLFDSEFDPYDLSLRERESIPHPEFLMADFNKLAKYIDQEISYLKNIPDRTDIFIADKLLSVHHVLDFSKFYTTKDGSLNTRAVLNETLKGIKKYSF